MSRFLKVTGLTILGIFVVFSNLNWQKAYAYQPIDQVNSNDIDGY